MRGPQTAGPLLRLSVRRWIAARSAARPISPSNTSSSRTRWPLPTPPIDGLHDICPASSRRKVSRPTRAPRRAAAAAASQPAWPAPITRTSCMRKLLAQQRSTWNNGLFAQAEAAEQSVEHILETGAAGQAIERVPRLTQQLGENHDV